MFDDGALKVWDGECGLVIERTGAGGRIVDEVRGKAAGRLEDTELTEGAIRGSVGIHWMALG